MPSRAPKGAEDVTHTGSSRGWGVGRRGARSPPPPSCCRGWGPADTCGPQARRRILTMDSAPRLKSASFCVFRHLLWSWPQGQTPERGLCAARKLGGALAVSCGSTPSPKAADPTRQPASGWRSRLASLPAQGSPVGSPWGPRPSRSPVVVTAPTSVTAKCRAPPPRGRPGRGVRAPTQAELHAPPPQVPAARLGVLRFSPAATWGHRSPPQHGDHPPRGQVCTRSAGGLCTQPLRPLPAAPGRAARGPGRRLLGATTRLCAPGGLEPTSPAPGRSSS